MLFQNRGDVMDKVDWKDSSSVLIEMKRRTVLQVAGLGVALGIAAWLLTIAIRQIVFIPLFCDDATNSMCISATANAGVVATIVVTIAGLMGLVRFGIYRPLLIAIAGAATLWGLAGWTSGLGWLEALLWSALLYALTYVAFLWIARIRPFVVALVIVVLVVILAKWLPVL